MVQDQNVGGSNPLSGIVVFRMYKYQLAVYTLYKTFGNSIFCTYEAEEALKKAKALDLYHTTLALARKHKLLEHVSPQEARRTRSNWHQAMTFRRLSNKGLEYAKYVDEHPQLITKHLLKRHNRNA